MCGIIKTAPVSFYFNAPILFKLCLPDRQGLPHALKINKRCESRAMIAKHTTNNDTPNVKVKNEYNDTKKFVF